jgi:glycosyltransferase involved in cell wall biosynthesis
MVKQIVFDCERMKYEDTGLFHYCRSLGNHLPAQARAGDEAIVFYTPYGAAQQFASGSSHIAQTELHKFVMPRLKDYAIWHAAYQDSYYLPFRNRKIKVVLTVHDLNFLYDDRKSAAKKQRYLRRMQMLLNRADAIACVSEYTKSDLLFYCDTGSKPVYVIHNGTNILQQPQLTRHSYRPLKPFVFSLGTITRKKNFHSLLPLVSNNTELELVIAGRPDDMAYYNEITEMAAQLGIDGRVHLTGRISENEKSWYFANCSAFAFPSTAEGFGLPVAEAMSVGKPLFLSCKTALPEIGGNVAFYFRDFSETIMQQTFETGMKEYVRCKMQDDIIQKGKDFCWNKAAAQYWEIYRALY